MTIYKLTTPICFVRYSLIILTLWGWVLSSWTIALGLKLWQKPCSGDWHTTATVTHLPALKPKTRVNASRTASQAILTKCRLALHTRLPELIIPRLSDAYHAVVNVTNQRLNLYKHTADLYYWRWDIMTWNQVPLLFPQLQFEVSVSYI